MFTLLFAESLKVPDEQEAEGSFLSIIQDSGGFTFGLSGHLRVAQAAWESDYIYADDNRDQVKLYTRLLNTQVNGVLDLGGCGAPFVKSPKQDKPKGCQRRRKNRERR